MKSLTHHLGLCSLTVGLFAGFTSICQADPAAPSPATLAPVSTTADKPATDAGDNLSCIKNKKRWILGVSGLPLSKTKFIYTSEKSCGIAVAGAHNHLTCAQVSGGFRSLNVKLAKWLGQDDAQFASMKDCMRAVSGSLPNATCVANSSADGAMNAVSTATNNVVGETDSVYDTLQTCESVMKRAINGLVCAGNSETIGLYQPDKGRYGLIAFADLPSCMNYNVYITSTPKLTSDGTVLKDLTKPYSQAPNATLGFKNYETCKDSTRYFHLVKKGKNGEVLPRCVPDVLYSWGDETKFQWFLDNMGEGLKWPANLKQSLYLTQSPSATFGYGEIPIRIKLKPGIKVKFFDDNSYDTDSPCDGNGMTAEEAAQTLAIRYWDLGTYNGVDYVLCGTAPIESWSFGQKRHYDEIVDDILWVQTHNDRSYELYAKTGNHDDSLYAIDGIDSHSFSEDVLATRMVQFKQSIEMNAGRIFYNVGVPKDEDEHFKTKIPSYFDPL